MYFSTHSLEPHDKKFILRKKYKIRKNFCYNINDYITVFVISKTYWRTTWNATNSRAQLS